MHGQKAYSCSICGEKYGVSYDLTRHYGRCRQKSWCMSCRTCLTDGESLAQHCSETGHTALFLNATVAEEQSNASVTANSCLEEVEFQSKERAMPSPCDASAKDLTLDMFFGGFGENIPSSISTPQASVQTGIPQQSVKTEGAHISSVHPKEKKKSFVKQKIAPKPIIPTPSFVMIPTQAATLILYQTTTNPSKAFRKLAPKSTITHLPVSAKSSHVVGSLDSCSTRVSRAMKGRLIKKAKPASSQATQTRRRKIKIKVAETQTTEDYEMQKTLSKQSCASQVSPQAKAKHLNQNVQSTQTQTSRSFSKKQKIKISEQPETSKAVEMVYDHWPDFAHNETQTMDFLQELCLAESSSTQTLESYLFDCLSSEICNDDGGNYDTISSQLIDSVMLPMSESSQKEIHDGLNTSVSDLFSSEISNIVSLEAECRDQCAGFPYQDLLNSSVNIHGDVASSSELKTFSAETQTANSDFISDFLTAASQTNDFDDVMSMTTETQTADDFFAQVWSHTETQTTDEFLTDFGFSDIETQTTWILGHSPLAHDVPLGNNSLTHRDIALTDMETQTYFQ